MTPCFDAVVVGSGLAGLTISLALAPRKTLLISKTPWLESGSTFWAQGGVAFPQGAKDIPLHRRDTLTCGDGESSPAAVTFMLKHAKKALVWLEEWGFFFDQDENGYQLGREGAHSIRRILHSGGDSTGKNLSLFLAKQVCKASHITALVNAFVFDFGIKDGPYGPQVTGVWVLQKDYDPVFYNAKQVFLAAGGLGQLFSQTTNPSESTGDAMAIALRAGLELKNMEMIQFHPTALAITSKRSRLQLPLLSEALRGEGAKLVVLKGRKVEALDIHHPLGTLGPRDRVARSICAELQQNHTVGLDARQVPYAKQRFPSISRLCQTHGYDLEKDILPVLPAVHYCMGGIPTTGAGKTQLNGLWALGECACTGVHGANRLASNSLLECLVFALQASFEPLPPLYSCTPKLSAFSFLQRFLPEEETRSSIENQLKNLLFHSAGPLREGVDLAQGLKTLSQIRHDWQQELKIACSKPDFSQRLAAFELENLFDLGREVLTQALVNTKSCGAHFRLDSLVT